MVLLPFAWLTSLIFLNFSDFLRFHEIDVRCSPVVRVYLFYYTTQIILIISIIERRRDQADWAESLNGHQSDSRYSEPFTELIKRMFTKMISDQMRIIENHWDAGRVSVLQCLFWQIYFWIIQISLMWNSQSFKWFELT